MQNEVLAVFTDVHEALERRAEAEGLHGMLGEGFAVAVKRANRDGPEVFMATLEVNHRLALTVPLNFFAAYRDGKLDLNPGQTIEEIIEFLTVLAFNAPAIVERKKAVERATTKVIALADKKGVKLELARIEERPVVTGDEEWRKKVFFDVSLIMLSEEDGQPQTYTIDAQDPEEFGNYLQNSILPRQLELTSRGRPALPH